MASTPDLATCISSNGGNGGGLSPVNPFSALRYQFGMLLGEAQLGRTCAKRLI